MAEPQSTSGSLPIRRAANAAPCGVSDPEERETLNVARASMRSPQGERGSLRRHRKNHAPARVLEGLGPETSTAPAPHINASGPRQGHVRAASGPRQRRQKRGRYATFGAPSCPRACVPLWANADPFEGVEKTMLPLGFWRGWGRKRAPHEHRTSVPVYALMPFALLRQGTSPSPQRGGLCEAHRIPVRSPKGPTLRLRPCVGCRGSTRGAAANELIL